MTFTVRGLVVPITGAGRGMGRLHAGHAVREGVREPALTPLPEPGYAVDRSRKATLTGGARVQRAGTAQFAGLLRDVLPHPARDVVADRVLAGHSSMEHFTGREASASRHNEDGS